MSVLAEEHGSFYRYLRSLDALDYYQRVKVLTSHFAGLGRTGASTIWNGVIDGPVPSLHVHRPIDLDGRFVLDAS